MKIIYFLLAVSILSAESLKSILDYAAKHNDLSKSKEILAKQPLIEAKSIKSNKFPKIYIGGMYQRYDPIPTGKPGDTLSGYIKISLNLYDGGKKKYLIESKKYKFKVLNFQSSDYKKQLEFNIVNLYFNIKILNENLKALKKAKEYLTAEYQRTKHLYDLGMTTEDNVKKIKASLYNTIYQIDDIKYQITSLYQKLSLYTGKEIKRLDNSLILAPKNIKKSPLDSIKGLKANIKEIEYNAKSLNSAYKPQINIEDSYNLYKYYRDDNLPPQEDNVNQITLSANILLFDNNSVKKQKEALLVQKLALQREIDYYTKEQNKNIKLALLNIQKIKSQIKSAKIALEAANDAFRIISNKFKVGDATIIDYLDALSAKTNAFALYKSAIYQLQIAYATYYLYTNNNIKNPIINGAENE